MRRDRPHTYASSHLAETVERERERERTSRSEQGGSKQNLEVQHTCQDTSFRSNLRGGPWNRESSEFKAELGERIS